jgi:hypothetical protein
VSAAAPIRPSACRAKDEPASDVAVVIGTARYSVSIVCRPLSFHRVFRVKFLLTVVEKARFVRFRRIVEDDEGGTHSSSIQRPRGSGEDGGSQTTTTKKRKRSSGEGGFAKFLVESSDDEADDDPWSEEVEEFLDRSICKTIDHLHKAYDAIPKGRKFKTIRMNIRNELEAASEATSDLATLARDLVHWAQGDGPKPSLK